MYEDKYSSILPTPRLLHNTNNIVLNIPQIEISSSIAWLLRYLSPVAAPRQLFKSLKGDFGGIQIPFMEVSNAIYGNEMVLSI